MQSTLAKKREKSLPMLKPSDLFDLSAAQHAALFDGCAYVWEALPRIAPYIRTLLATSAYTPNGHTIAVHPSTVIGAEVYIGKNVQIDPAVYIEGPAIIEDNCQIRHGAFVRANTLMSAGSIVGHASETKNAALLEGAAAPHFAYVGDSILGARVNLGAGTKLSNFPMNADINPATGKRPTIQFDHDGQHYDTDIVKFGAILGDDVQCGCNCVTNPGVIVGRRTLIYTLAMLRKGIYPANSIIKVRPHQETAPRRD